jgi:hypothetical protein
MEEKEWTQEAFESARTGLGGRPHTSPFGKPVYGSQEIIDVMRFENCGAPCPWHSGWFGLDLHREAEPLSFSLAAFFCL